MNVLEAEKSFASLVDKVHREGVSIDLERDNHVIARLTPAVARAKLTVGTLCSFLAGLPSLGDDANDFVDELRAIRKSAAAESSPWDC